MSHRVAILGFSGFERTTLGSYFRLAERRTPSYEFVALLDDADWLLADADHEPSVNLVLATERQAQTVFIGAMAPAGAIAWLPRPIDPMHIMRELDVLVTAAGAQRPAGAEERSTPLQAPPRARVAPVVDVPIELEPAPVAPVPPPPAEPPPLRALLVDDSEIALRFLESRLLPWGLRVHRAGDSDKAVEQLLRYAYDLVFLDVELGESSPLDGLGLCRHIKALPGLVGAQVVMVTAHRSELDRVRGALAGCDAYLGKPLDEVELARILMRCGLKAPKGGKVAAP